MGWTVGKVGWRAPAGGTYRIYAAGQSFTSGSNAPVAWNGASQTSSGDIDITLDPYPFDPSQSFPTVHATGVYSARAHVVFGGTLGAGRHATISAFDSGIAAASTSQVLASGSNPFDFDSSNTTGSSDYGWTIDGKITIAALDGYFFLNAGPGLTSGTTLTSGTYIEITKHA